MTQEIEEKEYTLNLYNQLNDEYSKILQSLEDLNYAIKSLKELKEIEYKKVLIPIINGVFAEARLENINKFKVNVGSNIVVTKTLDETIKFLEDRKKKIDENAKELRNQIDTLKKFIIEQSY